MILDQYGRELRLQAGFVRVFVLAKGGGSCDAVSCKSVELEEPAEEEEICRRVLCTPATFAEK
jgi:hypothetical protein